MEEGNNAIDKSIDTRKLIVAAGNGDLEEIKCLLTRKADVNFPDENGYTPLHHAVCSGKSAVVQQLLEDENVDIFAETNENRIPLDIAREMKNQDIIDLLVAKIIDNSFELLAQSPNIDKLGPSPKDTELRKVEKKIKQTKHKIESCLEFVKKINADLRGADQKDISYEQANIFIYFIETFALEGDPGTKDELKKYFSQFYTERDRKVFADARLLLLHRPNIKLGLEDIRKFINGDIKSFFTKLEEYVQYVQETGGKTAKEPSGEDVNSFSRKEFFFKTLKGTERNIGDEIDVGSYVEKEFEKLMVTSYTEENITEELLFNFVVNFYPAFQKETQADLRELSDLRNNLIHDFHKYGTTEFRKEICKLRHTLFKYYFAQQVNQALRAIEPDEDPEMINRIFREKLESFQDRYENVIKREYVISTDEAKDFFGYRPSQFLFSEKTDHLEGLVDQYLKFMVVIDCAQDNPIDNEQDQNPQSRKEVNASSRREIFEEFCRLEKIREHSYGNDNYYDDQKLKFEKKLLDEYGVPSHHFNRICSFYIENGGRQFDHSTESKKISDIIKSLKQIEDDYELSNRVVIYLYDQFLNNKDSFGSEEHRHLLGKGSRNMFNHPRIINKFKQLPSDEIINISIGEEILSISRGKVISNMLNTFYNAYHAYTIEFNLEEIFNDETFLDYLVSNAIENKIHNYMIIKKLLNVGDYTAPYIVRLIMKVGSDVIIEKDDLVRLVGILLMKKESLYIKSLNELLKIESRKLNLYEEVCNKITDPSFDIYSMHLIFEESQHVNGILTVLIDRIRLKDQSCGKMINLSRKVFDILVNSIFKFIFPNYEEALEISNRGLELIEVIKSTSDEQNEGELIGGNGSNDSIVAAEYNIKLKMAKIKNYQGRDLDRSQSPNHDQATKKYDEAMKILCDIPDNVHPQSLLALSRKAYTYSLLKRYDTAYQTFEDFYKKIVEFVCGCTNSYPKNTELYTKEIYTKIERSEKYKILLALSEEYKKYFKILNIRNSMAESQQSYGLLHNEVENCEKALEIYKEIYSYRKDNLGLKHKNTMIDVSNTAEAHTLISGLMSKQMNYQDALEHTEYALAQNVRLAKIQKDMYGIYHPAIARNMRFTVKNLDHIAFCNDKLGDAASIENEKKRFYQKALTLCDKIHDYRKRYPHKRHEHTWKTIGITIRSLRQKLDYIARGRPLQLSIKSSAELPNWRKTDTG